MALVCPKCKCETMVKIAEVKHYLNFIDAENYDVIDQEISEEDMTVNITCNGCHTSYANSSEFNEEGN